MCACVRVCVSFLLASGPTKNAEALTFVHINDGTIKCMKKGGNPKRLIRK